jgi:2Fe-2S ferredoxin
MVKAKFVLPEGEEVSVEAPEGWSVMEAARKFAVQGIVAECGGGATCSTCHVYVEGPWTDVVGPPSDLEAALLELAPGSDVSCSRLSCQIILKPELDGIVVRVPAEQYES